jgi:quercetin dioxygenase-like cupin family protein
MIVKALWALALITIGACATDRNDNVPVQTRVTLVYDHALPNVPGKSIRGVLVEYPPGGTSPAHIHARSAFIYATVLEGAVKSQVNEGPVSIFKAGESFSEFPGDRHDISANASLTQPARLLAVFVVDTSEAVLTTSIE